MKNNIVKYGVSIILIVITILTSLLFGCKKEPIEIKNSLLNETPFKMCDCIDESKTIYWKKIVLEDSTSQRFYSDVNGLLLFNPTYGTQSPKIYDFNGSGLVDAQDLLSFLSGYGKTPPTIDLCDINVEIMFSHGWQSNYLDLWCFVHPTLIDEQNETCPINTFWVEILYSDSIVKYWFH